MEQMQGIEGQDTQSAWQAPEPVSAGTGKRRSRPLAALLAGLAVVGLATAGLTSPAQAACTDLGGTVVGTECRITSPQVKTGTFTVESPLSLHFVDGGAPATRGSITTNGGPISITVEGDILMDDNTFISANRSPSPCIMAGAITLVSTQGNVSTKPLSKITSNACSGGPIVITAGQTKKVDIAGLVESVGSASGTGATQPPGGGTITITADCDITVTGKVSSRGNDPGADLVKLTAGCNANIFGLVESTGVGHVVPNAPKNHCSGGPFGNAKPANSVACVLIVAGDKIVVDSRLPNNGEINTDTGGPGGSTGHGWIDAFAKNGITVTGPTAAPPTEPFAVHSNGRSGTNDHGGDVTFKSANDILSATGFAFQADATNPGGRGGNIVLEAAGDVTLDDSQIWARGDFIQTGGFGFGGKVLVRSFAQDLNWKNLVGGVVSTGDSRPTGSQIPVAQRGIINLTACLTVDVTGTLFPVNGVVVPPYPVVVTGSCAQTNPDIPPYVTFPTCRCQEECLCIQSFNPLAGTTGQTLTIRGNGLGNAVKVVLSPNCNPLDPGAVEATILTKTGLACGDTSTITATIPALANGNYSVIAVGSLGSSTCAAGQFTKN